MTMRLDIVTNDAGENVRREHARELGAGVVVSIYRLVKVAQMHDLGNQAFVRQLEQTHQMIGEYCLRSGENVSVLFANKAVFVAGQLLKGNRGAYESASELGALLERLGAGEIHISREITREDCLAFAEQISIFHRTGNASQLTLPPRIQLRQVTDAARLRGMELEDLSTDQRILRTYASAVVVMRRFFEDLAASRYVLPRRIKRIAQSLVDLSDASTSSFLGVTEVRNANHDEAGRAVNTAILAVSIARECTSERPALSQIAMAAMMHDVARPRALALAGAGGPAIPGMAAPTTLSEDQEDRLPAGTAAVLTALGRVNEPTIARTVLTFEALWLRRRTWLGPVYWGSRPPTLQATIIAVARRYNDLLTPEPGLAPPTTDNAVATLAHELQDPQDRTVLRMLVSALGLLPIGTLVQLSTGEVAEVIRGARGLGDRPRVSVVADAHNQPLPHPIEVDLAHDLRRKVHRVLSVDGWQRGRDEGLEAPPPGPDFEQDVSISVPPPAMAGPTAGESYRPPPMIRSTPASAPPPEFSSDTAMAFSDESGWDDGGVAHSQPSEHPSASLPSLGSSPSAVAEAMGRMITESAAPPPPSAQAERPDRTVFQPNGPARGAARGGAAQDSTRDATAVGTLASTPLPHVLVYMLDHALTGSVVFEGVSPSPELVSDTIYFVNGVPAKIRLSDPIALIGELLVEDGSLDPASLDAAVEGARHLGILLGEYLVGHDLVGREALAWGLEGQLLRKIAHVANLAPEIQYSYYRDVDLLDAWGGEVVVSHPLNPILASVRQWTDRTRVRATLNRIGKHPLVLHPDSDLTNLAVIAEEQTVLDAIRVESMLLAQLLKENLADEEVVSSLVYSLAVTRQFSFKGQKKGPMAARGRAWRSVAPTAGKSLVPAGAASAPPTTSAPKIAAAPPASSSGPSHPSSQRQMANAARPAGASASRPGVPQIRKKPTMVGIQPGQVSRPPPPMTPQRSNAPLFAPPLASLATSAPSSPSPKPRSAETPDDPRTVAIASPKIGAISAAAPNILARKSAFGPPPGRTSKPSPSLPGGGSAKVNSPPAPAVRAPAPSAPSLRPAAPAAPKGNEDDATDPDAAERGDAEAALAAMTSFRLAEGALQRKDLAAAEEHARKALAAAPSQADYVALYAWIRALSGASPEEAIRTMSKVLIDDPSNDKALFYRAKLLLRTNRLVEALNDFDELLAANPHHREAQNEARQLRAKLQ